MIPNKRKRTKRRGHDVEKDMENCFSVSCAVLIIQNVSVQKISFFLMILA
jgi:hypothetical protein